MNESIYREQILELYKDPANKGELDNATHSHREFNPLCGDDITIQAIIKKNSIQQIRFKGEACAICTASASLITDFAKEKSKEEIKNMNKDTVMKLLQIRLSPTRLKCALLPLVALQHAIEGKKC